MNKNQTITYCKSFPKSSEPNPFNLTKFEVFLLEKSPLTFANFMERVLYHPKYGYYSQQQMEIGRQGDYFTSSSLGVDFGECLAQQWVKVWEGLDQPTSFQVVEMGAGKGVFAADGLNYLLREYPAILPHLEYIIIERSQSLIQQQQKVLQSLLDKGVKICWKTWAEIPDESITGCFFSNELVDAFPVHKLRIKQGELKEVYVYWQEGQIIEEVGELSTPQLQEYFKTIGVELPSQDYPEDYTTEVNLAALDWLKTVSEKLKQGLIITIDYGYPAHRYYNPQRYQGTLKCYFQHRHHDNPYVNLGQQDITAHVDFTALEKYGELYGLKTVAFTKQGMFLMGLGLGDRIAALSTGQYGIQQALQRRSSLHQLIDPTGLGGFGVLIQGKGLNEQDYQKMVVC